MDSDILAFFAQKIWPNEGSVKKKKKSSTNEKYYFINTATFYEKQELTDLI